MILEPIAGRRRKMEKVKCAVIGAGWWATTAHLPALRNHPQAELVAVQTLDRELAQKVADDFGASHACTTVEEVLAIQGLDAAIISSTPNVHYVQAKAALERGLHVLIEKPMTITADESVELVALAEEKGLQFLISGPWHYTAHGIEARRLVRSGALGQLKMISVLMTNFTLGLYQGLPWDQVFGKSSTLQNASQPYLAPGQTSYSDPSIGGGGQIYCQVSHAAAYLAFLTGRQPAEVFARFDNAGTAVDVYDSLNIKLDDGTLVSMASTGATMLSERNYEVRVYGTQGMILMELWKGAMEFHDLDCNVRKYPDIPEADVYPMFAPAENLVEVVLGKAPNGSPASLGAFAMKITEAACQSVRTNTNIVIV
jgi:predicted dehydrogenase